MTQEDKKKASEIFLILFSPSDPLFFKTNLNWSNVKGEKKREKEEEES